ncbi:hypothetical protein QYM36_014742 [Artemia franciscana]|uniref:Uncharacterized protein n=1 Tax=Artemia franciscana TaxID=6661 RepID=A0AA88HGV2_ARTSF|nr:hypothetical protein QYM36_014742 [Artemia franciscana]
MSVKDIAQLDPSDFSDIESLTNMIELKTYKALYKGSTSVMIKEFTGCDGNAFDQEAVLLQRLKHKNIVKYLGTTSLSTIWEGPQHVYDYPSKGSLRDNLIDRKLSINTRISIARDVASGMKHMSNSNIIKRNLSIENILLKEDDTAIVSDLMSGYVIPDKDKKGKYGEIQDFPRVAPEVFSGGEYGTSSDVYSFGVVLAEITCHCPLEQVKVISYTPEKSIDMQIFEANIPKDKNSIELYDIAKKCLRVDANERPTFTEIVGYLSRIYQALPKEAEHADSLPSKFFLVPPRCLESGQFSREQRQGELSWCMTADGVPIQGSLTRGFVRCAENGTVLERLSLGPICPSPDQAPKICTTECLHASCPGHKDAVCIADPCNGCRTAFYNSDGDEVSCEPICSQKIEKGMCRSSLQRWGFDPNSRQCEEFFYGGCGGNENNFDSLQKCQDTCKTIDRCSLPKNTGSCAKEAKRWFYNSGSQKCEEFIYTGCGGNANNFLTKEECEMTCPDLVMCPKLPNVNGEIPICSRSEVCEKEGCPDEDVVCTVDPCTCAPIFKNRKGKRVNCPFHSESGENYQSDVPIPNEIMRSGNMPLMKIIPAEVVTETAEEKMMRDKSKKIETEVIRMYNPAKEFVVRSDQKKIGKLTKQKKPKAMNLDVTAVMTRCKKMRQKMVEEKSSFVVDCDKQGRFAPTQCYMGTPSVCWCVDESGNQLKDTTMFMSGNRTCHYVPVKAVNVSLSIPMHDNHHPETNQIRKEIDFILNKLNVEIELYEPEMNHDEVRINFTLTGDNKIDAADYIEEMVRNGEFQVLMGDEIMPADYTSSKFVHVSGSPVLRQQRKLNFETLENREIIAEPLNKDIPYFAIILTMCIVSSFLILALIISLLLYRKKTTGEYPKGGGAPLAYGVHCRGKTEDIIPRGFPRVGLDDKEFQRSKPLSPVLPRFMKSGNTESMKL